MNDLLCVDWDVTKLCSTLDLCFYCLTLITTGSPSTRAPYRRGCVIVGDL